METITQESLTQSEWSLYERWYQQVRLDTQNEEHMKHNTVLILSNLKSAGYTVSAENLMRTLQRLYTLPRTVIYNQPDIAPTDARASQHTNKEFSKSGWNDQAVLTTDQKEGQSEEYVNGRRNWARVEKLQTPAVQPHSSDDARWQAMAESLTANTHSATLSLKQIVGVNPRDTYEKRMKFLTALEGGKS